MGAKNTEHTKHTKGTQDGEDTLRTTVELGGNTELMPDYKNIKVHEDTHERLQSHGNMGESFDDLINRILDDWEADSEDTETEGEGE